MVRGAREPTPRVRKQFAGHAVEKDPAVDPGTVMIADLPGVVVLRSEVEADEPARVSRCHWISAVDDSFRHAAEKGGTTGDQGVTADLLGRLAEVRHAPSSQRLNRVPRVVDAPRSRGDSLERGGVINEPSEVAKLVPSADS